MAYSTPDSQLPINYNATRFDRNTFLAPGPNDRPNVPQCAISTGHDSITGTSDAWIAFDGWYGLEALLSVP